VSQRVLVSDLLAQEVYLFEDFFGARSEVSRVEDSAVGWEHAISGRFIKRQGLQRPSNARQEQGRLAGIGG